MLCRSRLRLTVSGWPLRLAGFDGRAQGLEPRAPRCMVSVVRTHDENASARTLAD